MVAQALFTVLSARGGKAGKSGAVGLTLLGAGGTIGVLVETITYRVLSPETFDAVKAPIVVSALELLHGFWVSFYELLARPLELFEYSIEIIYSRHLELTSTVGTSSFP